MEKSLTFHIVPVTPFLQNCSILVCEKSRAACVVDPGGDIDRIRATIDQHQVHVEKILLTHGHLDHAGQAKQLAEQLGVKIIGPHQADQFWLDKMPEQSELFGFQRTEPFTPNAWLDDGDTVSFGEIKLEVIHCPGHTPGHVVFYHRDSALAVVGDVLFKGSIGRTDFPMSRHQDLIDSIKQKLFPLGDNIDFIPGHGEMSSFGIERETNPFVGHHSM